MMHIRINFKNSNILNIYYYIHLHEESILLLKLISFLYHFNFNTNCFSSKIDLYAITANNDNNICQIYMKIIIFIY